MEKFIKPLEWVDDETRHETSWRAETFWGSYRIFQVWWGAQDKWGFCCADTENQLFHTLADARAAAQADYAARIASALSPAFLERIAALEADARLLTSAERDIIRERSRQVTEEGWSAAHDDTHTDNELARAAACYCIGNIAYWPWDLDWWKPTDRRRNLIKAAALIVAEIERLDRTALTTHAEDGERQGDEG